MVVRSPDDAAAGGLEATYGAFLRGNAADILFHAGSLGGGGAERAVTFGGGPVAARGRVLAAAGAGTAADRIAWRRGGRQHRRPGISCSWGPCPWPVDRHGHALGHQPGAVVGRPCRRARIAEREWPRALESDELGVIAHAASTAWRLPLPLRSTVAPLVTPASSHVLATWSRTCCRRRPRISGGRPRAPLGACRRRSCCWPALAPMPGASAARPIPLAWAGLAEAWAARPIPYAPPRRVGGRRSPSSAQRKRKGRESARAEARAPLAEAYRLATQLPALPLLREIVDLAARARVALPADAEGSCASAAMGAVVTVGPGAPRGRSSRCGGPGKPRPGGCAQAPTSRGPSRSASSPRCSRGPADAYGLSPREREVLNILAEGRTDRDIAVRLFISERTVHVHVRRILAKLSVSSRTEAAGVAIRQGLVPMQAATSAPGSLVADDVASSS